MRDFPYHISENIDITENKNVCLNEKTRFETKFLKLLQTKEEREVCNVMYANNICCEIFCGFSFLYVRTSQLIFISLFYVIQHILPKYAVLEAIEIF